MKSYGALVLLWSTMSVAVPSDCGDDINVQTFFDRMIGEWKGEAVSSPVGPRPYDIAFKRLESKRIYGTADPGAAIHHWGFYCDKGKLWLRFLSTFSGNRDPILLEATAINVSEIHFKAKLPTFLEVKIRSGQTQSFIEVLHYNQRHVLIELVSTAQ